MNTLELIITPKACRMFAKALLAEGTPEHAIRVSVETIGRIRVQYALDFAAPSSQRPDDLVTNIGGVTFFADPQSATRLAGGTLDYVEDDDAEGFRFDLKGVTHGWLDEIAGQFQQLLDREINPGVASHGGQVTLLDYQDGVAYVQMGGGCQGCGMASVTLRNGVEKRVKEAIPQIKQIVDTTDHGAGNNPYYQPSM